VFPFVKFPGVDIVLGPEMKSTGEVMGTSDTFPTAFAKSQLAAGTVLPTTGKIFLSMTDRHKPALTQLARQLAAMGYELLATPGTADAIESAGIAVTRLYKIQDRKHPNLLDYLKDDDVALVMNTPAGKGARTDEGRIRAAAVAHGVPCLTTLEAATAAVQAMVALRAGPLSVASLQTRFQHDGGPPR
jgi:carbamoyl-phosphate synthase large subunit